MHEEQVEMPFPLTIKKRAPLELKLRLVFSWIYLPMLFRPRIDGKAG